MKIINHLIRNKSGLSTIIATVVLILMTISAFSILVATVVPLVKENLKKTNCFLYRDYFYFEEEFGSDKYNCYYYNSSNNNYIYTVSVGASSSSREEEISKPIGFKLIFSNKEESTTVDAINGAAPNSNEGGITMYVYTNDNITLPDRGEIKSYVYNGTKLFDKVEIAAIIEDNRVCDISDKIRLISCTS